MHLDRIADFAELECGTRARRRENDVAFLVCSLVVLRNERAHLLSRIIVLLVYAARKQVAAQHNAALGLHAEAGSAACLVLAAEVFVAFGAIAIANRVEARQIRERLARAQHVICGNGRIGMRKLDFHNFGARLAKCLGGFRNASLHLVGKAGRIHESGHNANAHAFDALLARGAEIGLHILRGAVHGIVATNGVHRGGGIAHAARERADLVKRAAERNHAITRNHAIGRLHANNAAERCRLAN